MTDYSDPRQIGAEIRAVLAGCDADVAVAAIAEMRETHPDWAGRIERELIAVSATPGPAGAS